MFAALAAACSGEKDGVDAEPRAAGPDAAVARIDEIAEAALAEGPLAGLSIAVVRGNDVIVSKGYGYADLAADLRRRQTRFTTSRRLPSCSRHSRS
jgi:CubicO group peptidase (beta-lactamase class C family)